MSLYREPGRRGRGTIVAAVLAGIVVLAIGFGIGRATAPEPSLESQLASLRADAAPAADALELVSLHYGAANETTKKAAQEQLDRAEQLFSGVENRLAAVDPAGTRAARAAIANLAAMIASGAPAAAVERAANEAEAAVRAIAGDGA
jgi:hypothetical protein